MSSMKLLGQMEANIVTNQAMFSSKDKQETYWKYTLKY